MAKFQGPGQNGRSEGATQRPGTGSDAAPTKKAQDRERERHRLERAIGRTAAEARGLERGRQDPGVTREDLRKAQREADRRVAGHALPGHDH